MINGKLEQFLDTGWFSEATLFYNGYIYWLEAQSNKDNKETLFFIDRWAAKNESNQYYHSVKNSDGTISWERVLEIKGTDIDMIKKQFLESPCFEGKTFWDVEKQLAWLDEGEPINR